MKIAILTDGIFPYVIGGMQKHSYNLVKYFARNKVYVDLYHTNQSEYEISKLEFFLEEEKRYIDSVVIDFPSLGKFPGHYIKESFEYSHRIFKLFAKRNNVDFIYAKGFTAWKLLDEKRKGYKCAPIGVNFHGFEMFQKSVSVRSKLEQVLLLRKPVLFNINNADYVFSYGGGITDIILNLGVPQSKIIESPAGIEKDWIVSQALPAESVRKFIFVGRYERRKGFNELVAVLNKLSPRENFEFSFVGDIPEKKRVSFAAVKYFGKISDAEILKSILRKQDILVCPSYSEGMPNVILEAMASGLAVIASDVGASNLLVSKNNGWLVRPGIQAELESAISEAIQMPAVRLNEMKNASRILAEKFLLKDICEKLIDNISSKLHNK